MKGRSHRRRLAARRCVKNQHLFLHRFIMRLAAQGVACCAPTGPRNPTIRLLRAVLRARRPWWRRGGGKGSASVARRMCQNTTPFFALIHYAPCGAGRSMLRPYRTPEPRRSARSVARRCVKNQHLFLHRFIMRLAAQGVACCAPTKKHHSVEKG